MMPLTPFRDVVDVPGLVAMLATLTHRSRLPAGFSEAFIVDSLDALHSDLAARQRGAEAPQ